jgi:alcohol dehydrogenase
MKTQAAVLRTVGLERPYTKTTPLSIEEVQLDEPGPGEVLVQLVATGLCHSDLSTINGTRPRPVPMVLGHEAAGIVRAVGPGVQTVVPDDHVVLSLVPACGRCVPCQTGRPMLCEPGVRANNAGTLIGGAHRFHGLNGEVMYHHLGASAFSEYTVVSEGSITPIDRSIPLEEAAIFGCAVLTGIGAVVNTARCEPGASAAIFGLGGVGLSAVIGAALAGCYPIVAVDVLETKLELARHLGASHTVKAGQTDTIEQIRSITGGGADYSFEAVGSANVLGQAYAATRRGGTTVAVGLAHPSQNLQIAAIGLVAEERTLKGSYGGSSVPRRDLPRYLALYKAGRLPINRLISGYLSLDQINSGFENLADGAAVRQIIRFGDPG